MAGQDLDLSRDIDAREDGGSLAAASPSVSAGHCVADAEEHRRDTWSKVQLSLCIWGAARGMSVPDTAWEGRSGRERTSKASMRMMSSSRSSMAPGISAACVTCALATAPHRTPATCGLR